MNLIKEKKDFYYLVLRYIIRNYLKSIKKVVTIAKIADIAIDNNKILEKE